MDLHLAVAVANHKGNFSRETVKSYETPKIEGRKGMQDGQEGRNGVRGKEHL